MSKLDKAKDVYEKARELDEQLGLWDKIVDWFKSRKATREGRRDRRRARRRARRERRG